MILQPATLDEVVELVESMVEKLVTQIGGLHVIAGKTATGEDLVVIQGAAGTALTIFGGS